MAKFILGFALLFVIVLFGVLAVKPVMKAAVKYPKIALLVVGSACLAVVLCVMILFLF